MIQELNTSQKQIENPINKNFINNYLHYQQVDKPTFPEVLFISTFPPSQCGIATYTQDLLKALDKKFNQNFIFKVCAVENGNEKNDYDYTPYHILNTKDQNCFNLLHKKINSNKQLKLVVIQHEFGLYTNCEKEFVAFIQSLAIPVMVVFHTILPNANHTHKANVNSIIAAANAVVVMTNTSAKILINEYGVDSSIITVIAHGTHLVAFEEKEFLKQQYNLQGRTVLSTFGLISRGKSIESTLYALPEIIKENPKVLYVIIGKTHPTIILQEGETYRTYLENIVTELNLNHHVLFINNFLPLSDLLNHLQLTDIYLFTSNDPNQAVSGTFAYAISCGCPIISTPIPHAVEVLKNDTGIIVEFNNPSQISKAVNSLLSDDIQRKNISSKAIQMMSATAWENAATAHAMLFKNLIGSFNSLTYNLPEINLTHLKKMTTKFGIIQFSIFNHPDISTGYTLDDNARALVAMCQHYELYRQKEDVKYIIIYFNFIKHCLQKAGNYLNYVDEYKNFTSQNTTTNLEDSNGRAIWAIGYLISIGNILPNYLLLAAASTLQNSINSAKNMHSTRAMAFTIKGLYYSNKLLDCDVSTSIIKKLADRIVKMYHHESEENWQWYESYLTYANSIIPEALLCAWLATGNTTYKNIARKTFDFLLQKIFRKNTINVISNKSWLIKNNNSITEIGGEQPIDVAYTIIALQKFYDVFNDQNYLNKMHLAFNWFLGANHLHQIIYNPCTGGCYDGLEDEYVNLNQGSESTVSYLMARLTIEKENQKNKILAPQKYLLKKTIA